LEAEAIIHKQILIRAVSVAVHRLLARLELTSVRIDHCEVALFVVGFGVVPDPLVVRVITPLRVRYRQRLSRLNVFAELARLLGVVVLRDSILW